MSDAKLLVSYMAEGRRVLHVSRNMHGAARALNEAIAVCDEIGLPYKAHKSNGRVLITSGKGSVRFTSERAQLRGYLCDVLVIDDDARVKDWMTTVHNYSDIREVLRDE